MLDLLVRQSSSGFIEHENANRLPVLQCTRQRHFGLLDGTEEVDLIIGRKMRQTQGGQEGLSGLPLVFPIDPSTETCGVVTRAKSEILENGQSIDEAEVLMKEPNAGAVCRRAIAQVAGTPVPEVSG